MLKLAGELNYVHEKVEGISWAPGLQTSGDLIATTKTVTLTAEASGLGSADYSAALTLPAPSDARILVRRLLSRLSITIDSFNVATILYCRVYVDAQDSGHLLFDRNWNSTGNKLALEDVHSGNKPTIFNLLKDGAVHTFYFFFWVNQANNAIISLAQVWEAVGPSGWYVPLVISHTGTVEVLVTYGVTGTGTLSLNHLVGNSEAALDNEGQGVFWTSSTTSTQFFSAQGTGTSKILSPGWVGITGNSSVATDIGYIINMVVVLRSEQ
ncbi:MAG: hypothetical protein V1849_02490 [Chloroflexota bacterium]